jgi:predicted nucleic acid-binding protein
VTADRQGLLDTSTVILLDRIDASDLPAIPLISAVSLAELSVGPLATTDLGQRAIRQVRLQEVEAMFDPLPFDSAAARAFGRLAASLRSAGRQPAARAFDALIAATALANELAIFTCNPDGFAGVDGLEVVAVPHPDHWSRPGPSMP